MTYFSSSVCLSESRDSDEVVTLWFDLESEKQKVALAVNLFAVPQEKYSGNRNSNHITPAVSLCTKQARHWFIFVYFYEC